MKEHSFIIFCYFILDGIRRIIEPEDSGRSDGRVSHCSSMSQESQPYAQRWRDTMMDLHSFQDLLVKDLLAVWEVEVDTYDALNAETADVPTSSRRGHSENFQQIEHDFVEMNAKDKVSMWLDRYCQSNSEQVGDTVTFPSPAKKARESDVSPSSNRQALNISVEEEQEAEFARNVSMEASLLSTQPKKPSKRSKKYVKGF